MRTEQKQRPLVRVAAASSNNVETAGNRLLVSEKLSHHVFSVTYLDSKHSNGLDIYLLIKLNDLMIQFVDNWLGYINRPVTVKQWPCPGER